MARYEIQPIVNKELFFSKSGDPSVFPSEKFSTDPQIQGEITFLVNKYPAFGHLLALANLYTNSRGDLFLLKRDLRLMIRIGEDQPRFNYCSQIMATHAR